MVVHPPPRARRLRATMGTGAADSSRPLATVSPLLAWSLNRNSPRQSLKTSDLPMPLRGLSASSSPTARDTLTAPVPQRTPGLTGRGRGGVDGCRLQASSQVDERTNGGYARVSTEQQDLTAQRNGLHALGVGDDRIYVDGLLGTNRDCLGLRLALAACRAGDTWWD